VIRTDDIADAPNHAIELIKRTGSERALRCADPGSAALIAVPLGSCTLPHPGTVHDLVDALADLGWSSVLVGGRLSQLEVDLGADSVESTLTQAGYGGVTPRGRHYEIVDVAGRTATSPCPEVSVLAGRPVSAGWTEAALRVIVAHWSESQGDVFTAATAALLSCADDIPGASAGDVAADLVEYLPPAFAMVEVTAADQSRALVGSTDVVLTDAVTAVLCGVDPAASRLLATTLKCRGLPAGYRLCGDVEPLAARRTETRMVTDAMRLLDDTVPAASRTLRTLMSADQPADHDGDKVLSWLQRTVGPLIRPDAPTRALTVETVGYAAGGLAESLAAWRTNFAKDDVPRVVVPLGIDPDRYKPSDYRAIPAYLESFTTLLDAAQPEDPWLRWCYFDESVLFDVRRVVNAHYSDFVERVDVAEGISLMADYLGGRRVAVASDDRGRPIHQVERNIYLPQPNYLAFWGGKPIDVCKIEFVEYTTDFARMYWKTVASPNGSAIHDDGQLTFADAGAGRTSIMISGRQHFTLPLFWQAVDLDRFPALKNELVTDAYRKFFSATLDNFEACFEGRPFRIGVEATAPSPVPPTEAISAYLDIAREWVAERSARRSDGPYVDENGFRHFPGRAVSEMAPWRRTARQVADEYLAALRNDAERVPRW
jgi:hypothetical protein